MKIEESVLLAPLTTLKLGGAARFFITVFSVEELEAAISFARAQRLPVFVLGGGSNILVADDGYSGVVISLAFTDEEIVEDTHGTLVTVGAGTDWDTFVARMVQQGYAGLEALSGIPGTVGGAVVANAGAYGTQCSDVFVAARVIDLTQESLEVQIFKNEDCNFAYHDSMFSQRPGRYIVLSATFRLVQNSTPDFSYKDNRFNFTDVLTAEQLPHTFAGLRAAVLLIREKKGVLEKCYRSAGSFFHMPYVSAVQHAHILDVARALDKEKEERLRPWAWRQTDGSYKLAPGFLLEYTPFQKGYVRGEVGISPKHTLSIINLGDARATQVAELARDMHDAIQKLFSISLEREVQYVGEVEK